MTAILTAAKDGDTGNTTVTGSGQLAVGGAFSSGAEVVISITSRVATNVPVPDLTIRRQTAKILNITSGTTLIATVKGGDANTSIDVEYTE